MKKLLLLFCLLGPLIGIVPREAYADIAANAGRDVYTGNASTTAFTGTFKILTSANVSVYLDGVLKVLGTHYTLSGVGNDAGFTVIFLSAPNNGVQVLLLRNQPIEQTSSYIPGSISAATIERDFDRQTSINQQQQEQLDRSFKFNATITPSPPTLVQLPSPAASKCWAWNSGGTAVEYVTCGSGGGGGSTSPGGSNTQVQFNDSGSFGGDADLTWNKTTNTLTVASGGDIKIGSQSVCQANGTGCPAGSGDDQTAAEVPFTPTGTIAATNVQTALAEVASEAQPVDTDLTCIAALGGTGYVTRTGAGTCAARKINGTAEQIAVANDDGVSANPTLSIPSPFTLPGILQATNTTPSQITADQNNYSLGATLVNRLSTDAARTITGFAAPTGFRIVFLANTGGFNLLLANESASSTAANRITTVRGGTLTIPPNSLGLLIYDVTSARWRAFDMAPFLTAEADTADSVFTRGKTVTGCTSFVLGCFFGDSSNNGVKLYYSVATGPVVACVIAGVENACDHNETLGVGFAKNIKNNAGTTLFKVDQASGVTVATGLAGGFSIPIARDGGLADTDDFPAILRIPFAQTITKICGRTDTGTTTLNVQRDDGSAANILTSNLVAATSEVCSTTFVSGENVLSQGHYLSLVIVTAATSGTPTKLTVSFETIRN